MSTSAVPLAQLPFRCNLCCSEEAHPLYTVRGFDIVRCRRCQLIAIANAPSLEALAAYYDEGYYTGGNTLVYQDYLGKEASRRAGFRARLRESMQWVPTTGRLLEVGSAYGLFLDVAREAGWKTTGVELSPFSSEYARAHLGLDVYTGDLASVPLADPFDLAVAWDVIEHLSDPMGTLQRINARLRPGGMVVLSTGNTACLGPRLYGERWHLFAPPWHLFFFTPRTMRRMLEQAGMRVVAVTYDCNPFYNHPVETPLDRLVSRLFCNRWAYQPVTRLAARFKGGLAFTIYARKVTDACSDTRAR